MENHQSYVGNGHQGEIHICVPEAPPPSPLVNSALTCPWFSGCAPLGQIDMNHYIDVSKPDLDISSRPSSSLRPLPSILESPPSSPEIHEQITDIHADLDMSYLTSLAPLSPGMSQSSLSTHLSVCSGPLPSPLAKFIGNTGLPSPTCGFISSPLSNIGRPLHEGPYPTEATSFIESRSEGDGFSISGLETLSQSEVMEFYFPTLEAPPKSVVRPTDFDTTSNTDHHEEIFINPVSHHVPETPKHNHIRPLFRSPLPSTSTGYPSEISTLHSPGTHTSGTESELIPWSEAPSDPQLPKTPGRDNTTTTPGGQHDEMETDCGDHINMEAEDNVPADNLQINILENHGAQKLALPMLASFVRSFYIFSMLRKLLAKILYHAMVEI